MEKQPKTTSNQQNVDIIKRFNEHLGLDLNLSDWKIWAENKDYIEFKNVKYFKLDYIQIRNVPTLIMLKSMSYWMKLGGVSGVSGCDYSYSEYNISNYGLTNEEICAVLGKNKAFIKNPNIKLKLFNPDGRQHTGDKWSDGCDVQMLCLRYEDKSNVDEDEQSIIFEDLKMAAQRKFDVPRTKNEYFYVNGMTFHYRSITTETLNDTTTSPVFIIHCFDENDKRYQSYNLPSIQG